MTGLRFHSSRPDHWTQPRNPDGWHKTHGQLLPMDEAAFLAGAGIGRRFSDRLNVIAMGGAGLFLASVAVALVGRVL